MRRLFRGSQQQHRHSARPLAAHPFCLCSRSYSFTTQEDSSCQTIEYASAGPPAGSYITLGTSFHLPIIQHFPLLIGCKMPARPPRASPPPDDNARITAADCMLFAPSKDKQTPAVKRRENTRAADRNKRKSNIRPRSLLVELSRLGVACCAYSCGLPPVRPVPGTG